MNQLTTIGINELLYPYTIMTDLFLFYFLFLVGRYCEWTHKTVDRSAETETFEQYKETLDLKCDPGEPGVFNWTVADETPDLVYYQVIL